MKMKWIVWGLLWASSCRQAVAQEYKLWYDEPARVRTEALPPGNGRLGAMVFEGKYLEAQTPATEKVMAKTHSGMPYQPFGDLHISFPGHTRYSDYYRELSLDSARAMVLCKVFGMTNYFLSGIVNTHVISIWK